MPGAQGRSGGKRIGAGRHKEVDTVAIVRRYVLPQAQAAGISPLDYMLTVMRDNGADVTRRDRMAMAAAPYCHPKISDQQVTKGQLREQAAKESGEWSSDLVPGILHAGTGKTEFYQADN